MNGSGDIPLTHSATPERPCGLTSIIPALGMSSCRGRAEAFARRLQSKLRTLGSQSDESPTNEENPIITNGTTPNSWLSPSKTDEVTNHQPMRNDADAFFEFDSELESPGSPAEECEYSRLIETASNTPHDNQSESGYLCVSPKNQKPVTTASSSSSSDDPYFDPENSIDCTDLKSLSASTTTLTNININPNTNNTNTTNNTNPNSEFFDCDDTSKLNDTKNDDKFILTNGHNHYNNDQQCSSESESLPPSQDSATGTATNTPLSSSNTCTESSSASTPLPVINIIQDNVLNELHKKSQQFNNIGNDNNSLPNGYSDNYNAIEQNDLNSYKDNSNDLMNGHRKLIENTSITSTTIQTSDEIKNSCDLTGTTTETTTTGTTTGTATNESQRSKLIDDNCITEIDSSQIDEKHLSAGDTEDEDDCRPQRVRRCSSLKTGKTPPGTPGRKKIVRFADVLGLDLADVKTFLDEIPTIPKSAFEDLEVLDTEPPIQLGPKADKILMPLFQQPGGLTSFLDIVREKQVSLENAAVSDHINLTVSGSVRVRNLDFHKSVHIRYSLDNWRSFADLQANYVQNSCDGFSDKFTFIIFGNSMVIGQRLEFAVRFQCKGQQFWDNNYGTNYCFQCLPASCPASIRTPSIIPSHHLAGESILNPATTDVWCGSFY